MPAGGRQPVHGGRRCTAGRVHLDPGPPALFRSSSAAERGFCRDCGTPLTFRYLAKDSIDVTLGSLDQPAAARPTKQRGIERRVPWWQGLFGLPGMTTADDPPPGGLAALDRYQRRDRDA